MFGGIVMRLIRFGALLLAVLLFLPACGQESVGENVSDTTVSVETVSPEPVPELAQFTITRSDGDDTMIERLQSTRDRILALSGVELHLGSDLVVKGVLPEPEYEILLGETAREASQAVYAKLRIGSWAVVREGTKIVIAGRGSDPLDAAIAWFFDHYFQNGALVFPADAAHYDEYAYDVFYDILVGLTFNLMGDSYVDSGSLPSGATWGVRLADKYDMTLRKYGKSGNAIASPDATGTPMVQRYTAMKDDADIVMVVGGRNDYNQRYPIGNPGDTTADTFCGALSILIDGLRAKYPDSLILFSTSWYVNEEMKQYTDAMLAVCQEKGIPCFNAADQSLSGVYMTDAVFRMTYCIKPEDVSHLNDAGMKLVIPVFEKFIAEEAEKFWAK